MVVYHFLDSAKSKRKLEFLDVLDFDAEQIQI
jgi:hypothetical protein